MPKFNKGDGGYWKGKVRKGLETHPAVSFNCEKCETPFKRSYYAYKKGLENPKMMPKFCSRKCQLSSNKHRVGKQGNQTAFKSRDLRLIGEANHNWKGGVSPLAEKIRRLVKYIEWRTTIFIRDNYTCQQCNKRGGDLEADHYPLMFFEILDKNNIQTVEEAIHCAELWNIDNGWTLCQPCHREKTLKDLKRVPRDSPAIIAYQQKRIRTITASNTTGFKNVCQDNRTGKYIPFITIAKNKQKKLGSYNTPEEAYEVYKQKALEMYGTY